eukprot:4653460-Prymnesium_polylepis.1
MSAACCRRAHTHTAQRFDHPRRELDLLIAVPEPRRSSMAERVDGTAHVHHQAVHGSRGHRARSDAAQPLDGPRCELDLLIAVAQLTKPAIAERVDGA